MVSSVDLDNMPSDIVVMLAAQSIAEKSPGSEIGHVVGALSTHGTSRGLSGGSINGILEAVTSPRDSSHDPLESERKGGRMSFLSRLPDGSFASLRFFLLVTMISDPWLSDASLVFQPLRSYKFEVCASNSRNL